MNSIIPPTILSTIPSSKSKIIRFSTIACIGLFLLLAGFSGPTLAESDFTDINNNETYWDGQTLTYSQDSFEEGQTVQLIHSESDTVVEEFIVSETNSITINTNEISFENYGEFTLNSSVSFFIEQQSLNITFDNSLIDQQDSPETDISIESNRPLSDFTVQLNSNQLSTEELDEIFRYGQQTDTGYNISANELTDANFETIESGSFVFMASVTETNITEEFSITLYDSSNQFGSFTESEHTVTHGDSITLTQSIENTPNAQLELQTESGETVSTVTVESTEELLSDEFSVTLNTHMLSQESENPYAIINGSDSVEITNYSIASDFVPLEHNSVYSIILTSHSETLDSTELSVKELQLSDATIQTNYQTPDTVEAIESFHQTQTISYTDTAIMDVDISGIFGYIYSTQNVAQLNQEQTDNISISVERLSEDGSSEPIDLEQTELLVNPIEKSVYISTNANLLEKDVSYVYSIHIPESNPYTSTEQEISSEFQVVEPTLEFDIVSEEEILVRPQSETIQIETNLAPQNELTFTIDENDSIKQNVSSTQEIELTYSFEEYEIGDRLPISITEISQKPTIRVSDQVTELTVFTRDSSFDPIEATISILDTDKSTTNAAIFFDRVPAIETEVYGESGSKTGQEIVDLGTTDRITLTLREEDLIQFELFVKSSDEQGIESTVTIRETEFNTNRDGLGEAEIYEGSYPIYIEPDENEEIGQPIYEHYSNEIEISDQNTQETIELPFQTFTYTIFVVNNDGESVPNSEVSIYTETETTGEDGIVEIELPMYLIQNDLEVTVETPFYQNQSVTINPQESNSTTITVYESYRGELGILVSLLFITFTIIALAGISVYILKERGVELSNRFLPYKDLFK